MFLDRLGVLFLVFNWANKIIVVALIELGSGILFIAASHNENAASIQLFVCGKMQAVFVVRRNKNTS